MLLVYDRHQSLIYRMRAGPHHFHLGEGGSGNDRLEEPKHPVEDSRNVDEEFTML